MDATKIRTRFAPSPTGNMHLGNVRTAMLNYLFARQHGGRFILRIEDTDQERSTNEFEVKIFEDLEWLGLNYHEGPNKSGTHGPYCQSERTKIYENALHTLIKNRLIYRCFCTAETLEENRKKQLAEGNPPRYDRTCLGIPEEKIKQKIAFGKPFVWRFKLNDKQKIVFKDFGHGEMSFDMANFSDFTLTRPDGSFTFIFTNFVDDWKMEISHVIRGEDHLSNTALQGALAHSLAVEMPIFWHLPMMCDIKGKKLSKRSAHFSLEDLRNEGFLPEAICNYLALVGTSLKNEIQSLSELTENLNFEHINSSGAPRYDVEKLEWINHKWIQRLGRGALLKRVKPFLEEQTTIKPTEDSKMFSLIEYVRDEAKTLVDFPRLLSFYFTTPEFSLEEVTEKLTKEHGAKLLDLLRGCTQKHTNSEDFIACIKKSLTESKDYKPREVYSLLRYLLTGTWSGMCVHDLLEMLDYQTIKKRIQHNG